MSLAAICGASALRAALVCLIVVPLARTIANSTRTERGPFVSAVWGALALLCGMPDLAVGYAWAEAGLERGSWPLQNELLYLGLLSGKLLPLASVLCLAGLHERLSPSARKLLALAGVGWPVRFGLLIRGLAPSAAPIAGVVFLLAFQDFELASRLGVRAWTVTLFDLHAREGLPLTDSLALTALPAAMELAVILPALGLAWRHAPRVETLARAPRAVTEASVGPLLILLVTGVCFVPAGIVLRGAWDGLHVLIRDAVYREQLPQEIALGMAVAVLSALLAMTLGDRLAASLPGRPWVLAAVLPGLLGGLVLSLTGRWAALGLDTWWQHVTGRAGIYHTPLPLIAVQILLLLPRALLISLLLARLTPSPAEHLGQLLRHSRDPLQQRAGNDLAWRGRGRWRFWSVVLLAWWGYWDLTSFSLLAPTGFVSAPVRLYNFMHFRQNAVLSAMLLAAIAVPAALAFAVSRVSRFGLGRGLPGSGKPSVNRNRPDS